MANSNNTACITPTVNCKSGKYNVKNQCKSCPGCNGMVCFATPSNATNINQCYTTVPAGKNITCTSAVCSISSCTGNTYSQAQSVNFKSGLYTKCTSCGKKKLTKIIRHVCKKKNL